MIDPAIGALLAGAFALLFASAAFNKLHSLQRFAEVFRAYRLLPDAVARLAWLVPALELTVGVGLLARRSRAGASAAGAALLLAYAAAIAINLQRGRRDLACGCGGLHEGRARAGALMLNRGRAVGEPAPVLEVADLEGHAPRVGAARTDGRSTLLLFVSPTCPVCKSLLPAVKSSRKDERAWMDVILASDGDTLEQRQFVRSQGLDGIPYVVSAALGLAYQVARPPFAPPPCE